MLQIKVCHMTSAHQQEDTRIFHNECVSLAKAGYKTYLVSCGRTYEKMGVHIIGVGKPNRKRLARMIKTSRQVYLRALKLDADIYHFHDPELLPYGLKLKRAGKIVIFDSHESTAEAILEKAYIPLFVRKMTCKLFSMYQKRVCKRIDAVVTVTPSLTRFFERISSNVVEVRNYPIFDECHFNNVQKERRIAFVGGVTKQWNHHNILAALEKTPDCTYCLCGPCDKEYLNELKKMKAWNQVNYMGEIPHSQVNELLASSTIGVALLQPGENTDWKNGTMGNTKIFEEMMAGLPIVCTDFILWKELVDECQCGICVQPDNPEDIFLAISYLLNHPKEALRMGMKGKKAVKEKYCWEKGMIPLLDLYNMLSHSAK